MKQAGFTLIEIIIALAIFGMLAGLGFWVSIDFYRSYAFNREVVELVSLLARAREQSMSNIGKHRHGVKIQPQSFVLFEEENPSLDISAPTEDAIKIFGSLEIIFERLSGENSAPGSLSLTDGKRHVVISVDQNGKIAW